MGTGALKVSPCKRRKGSYYRKEFIESRWEAVAPEHGVSLTWYQATRHTFTTRALEAGASLDEVSAALGHSSPVVTKRYYDHFVRKSFSPVLRQGLGFDKEPAGEGEVVPLRKARKGRGGRAKKGKGARMEKKG